MTQLLDTLFRMPGLQPFGATLEWRTGLVAVNAVSHALILVVYLVISMAIWIVLRRRADLPRRARRVALLVVVLLVAAAGMHLAEMVTLWVPAYGMLAAPEGLHRRDGARRRGPDLAADPATARAALAAGPRPRQSRAGSGQRFAGNRRRLAHP